ncbi:MAG TPA: DUF5677 domain-containing protein [Steroidobacteraceae bacterium]
MGFTTEAVAKNKRLLSDGQNRAWDVWDRPPPSLPGVTAAFHLFFPTSELAVRPNQRPVDQWQHVIFIEPAPRGQMVNVTLFITAGDPELRAEHGPSCRLASLSITQGRCAQLVAYGAPEADIHDVIRRGVSEARARALSSHIDLPPETYGYFLGKRDDGSRYIVGARVFSLDHQINRGNAPTENAVTFTNRVQAHSTRMLQSANDLLRECKLTEIEYGMLDPKILTFLLLCRTIKNYEAVILLVERQMVVEARTLARCCCENMFLAGGLHDKGREFADLMKQDDDAGKKHRLKFARTTKEIFESLEPEVQQQIEKALESAEKPKMLSPKSASSVGVFKTAYLAHSKFSGDAAHATLTALARYWHRTEEKAVEFHPYPEPSRAELDQTLLFASMAVLGLLGTVNEMFGGLPTGASLIALRDEHQALQNEEGGNG